MKTINVYFNETHKRPFLAYAMKKARDQNILEHSNYTILKYFTLEKVEKITDYYIKKHNTYCNNKGEYYEFGELHTQATKLTDAKTGEILTDYDSISKYLNHIFENNRKDYIEEIMYLNIWCEIERLLRLEYQNKLPDNDRKFLQKVYRIEV